jgi:hypothetical protein
MSVSWFDCNLATFLELSTKEAEKIKIACLGNKYV